MAKNRFRKGKTKMLKTKRSSKRRFVPRWGWLRASMRVNIVLMLVVVLAFATAGTYFYQKSHAISFNITCPRDGIDYGYPPNKNYAYCIGQIKNDFDDVSTFTGYNFIWADPGDWYWGWRVSDNTYQFQRAWGISQDGIFGPVTWDRMCNTISNHGHDRYGAWSNSVLEADYFNSGCNNGW